MKKFGLIGYPLSHSYSKTYFYEKFQKENLVDCSYELFSIQSLHNFGQLLKQNPELIGLNITIPHKIGIINYLSEVDEEAKKIGAVNTIKIYPSDSKIRLKGYNTDAYAFETTLKPLLKVSLSKALILGTGGASKAVAFVLGKLNIEYIFISRAPKKENEILYSNINQEIMNNHKIIINTTPLGMHPNTHDFPPIPYEYITSSHLLYDLIYNPQETMFVKKGKDKGAITQNGLAMFKLQAEKSWEIWISS